MVSSKHERVQDLVAQKWGEDRFEPSSRYSRVNLQLLSSRDLVQPYPRGEEDETTREKDEVREVVHLLASLPLLCLPQVA